MSKKPGKNVEVDAMLAGIAARQRAESVRLEADARALRGHAPASLVTTIEQRAADGVALVVDCERVRKGITL